MNTGQIESAGGAGRRAWSVLIGLLAPILFSATALAQAPAAGAAPTPLSAEELTKLVGPIALYPDDLVAIILPAATSPLQIVQADRYLEKRKSDPNLKIDDKWDDPVKSLLNYPDVVKMMSNDLDWTSELGEAVVEDQAAVTEAVQIFRRQAQAAGNLKTDAKQVVKTEQEIIVIQPADPQVVYVPQYNPSTVVVYGAPPYVYYPTPYPSYYYPYAPGAAMAAGVIWGAAIGAAWSGNRYGYGGGDITVNRNTEINRGGNTVNQGGGRQGGGSSQWKSNKQPGQVSSSVGKSSVSGRAGDARGGGSSGRGGASAGAGGAGGAAAGGGGRGGASAGPSAQKAGGGRGGDSAMGGYGSGRQATADSSRGASSRSSASGRGGGASRGGGGGGGGRGGVVVVAVGAERRSETMSIIPSIAARVSSMNRNTLWSLLTRAVLALLLAVPLAAIAASPQSFATPEAAVDALVSALKAEDAEASLLALFGDEHKDAIVDPDPAVRSANRAKILAALQAFRVLREPSADRRVLVIGDQAWPFPIPLVKAGERWRFATDEGVEELINRRIGGNERNAIQVLRAYIDAQRAYAAKDRDGDGVLQYAQKVMSSAGRQDGLYWPADATKGEEPSPFGPLIAEAAPYTKGHMAGDPYRGYYFRILTGQGKNAAGGAYSYVINGRMIAGFAMMAYPAVYDGTGVKTFIVNHNGTVYERDLGPNTATFAAGIKAFDPGKGWNVVKPE